MRVRILGSAAGGGFPQWNCNCANCRGLKSRTLRAKPRTQCSVAVSAGGARWVLLNASPDLRAQISEFPELTVSGGVRGTAIDAVMLTDAEIDHITGLLSLRETERIQLYCTARVSDWAFASNPIFEGLNFQIANVDRGRRQKLGNGLLVEAIFVDGKIPRYVKTPPENCEGAVVGYKIVDERDGASILYVPAIRQIDDAFIEGAAGCDCIMFDGSFWSDDEMERLGAGTRTAKQMGHVPISGAGGSLERLAGLKARKIYTHINNTNPILDEDSAERREVEKAGWEVAEDGMELHLKRA